MYNSYDEYMRGYFGYPYPEDNFLDDGYRNIQMNGLNDIDSNEIKSCYPEIYKIIKPMVTRTCQMNSNRTITREIVEEITMEIYTNIETAENRSNDVQEQRTLKNGDVINPNAKLENREDRSKKTNYLLKDLIKILVINELLNGKCNNNRPPMPPPRPQYGPGGYQQPFYGGIMNYPQMRQF